MGRRPVTRKIRMKSVLHSTFALLLVIGACLPALAQDKLPGQIHDYPPVETSPNQKLHQLAVEWPRDGIARAEFRSEEFFAIILKSGERCSLTEAERKTVQDQFPRNKVFMDYFQCDEPSEDYVRYSNVNPDYSFIAVFGGQNFDDADGLFKSMDLQTAFPGANIRKMQAVLVYP